MDFVFEYINNKNIYNFHTTSSHEVISLHHYIHMFYDAFPQSTSEKTGQFIHKNELTCTCPTHVYNRLLMEAAVEA